MRRIGCSLLLASLLAVHGSVAAESWFRLDTEPGASTNGGGHLEYTEATGTITATSFGGGAYVSVRYLSLSPFASFVAQFSAAPGSTLAPGVYEAAGAPSAVWASSPHLGLQWDCPWSFGTFEVHELSLEAGTNAVLSFRARFEGRCHPDGPATSGEVRYRTPDIPRLAAPMRVRAPRGREVAFEVAADGPWMTGVRLSAIGSPDGATFEDHGDGTGSFRWNPPADWSIGDIDVRFEAALSGNVVAAATTRLSVRGATWLRLRSEPGDWVGRGEKRGYRDVDGWFLGSVRSFDRQTAIHFKGWEPTRFWFVNLAAPDRQSLSVGAYRSATSGREPGLPVLWVGGEGRSCSSTGSFDVHEVRTNRHGIIDALWATFEQRCSGSDAALRGEIRFNADSAPNHAPVADAGHPARAECAGHDGARVTLSASASYDPDGDEIAFRWTAPGIVFDDPSGTTVTATFPLGSSEVTLGVGDGLETATSTVEVVVVDTTPPTLLVEASPDLLWPPNGALRDVALAVEALDRCEGPTRWRLESVASSEPADPGVADVEGAEIGSADTAFRVRASRDGRGDGRTYTITIVAQDASGNAASARTEVGVPHDRRP